jgi:hypothetical protein
VRSRSNLYFLLMIIMAVGDPNEMLEPRGSIVDEPRLCEVDASRSVGYATSDGMASGQASVVRLSRTSRDWGARCGCRPSRFERRS